jgi:hypothetical protein
MIIAVGIVMIGLAQADLDHPGLTPATVEDAVLPGADLGGLPGTEIVVEKTVHTPEIPPKPDVYFLADTTGSMSSIIAQVKTDSASILAAIDAATTAAQYGAGDYKDFPFDPYAFNHNASIGPDDGVGSAADASDTINSWTAGGGSDGSEGQFFAMDAIAMDPGVVGWRADSSRILVWFGDAPAHDPVCSAISGLGYNITEASVTADLQAAGIRVVAISTLTGFPDALNDSPSLSAGDYSGTCAIDGASGQATRIAAATGGVHLAGVAAGNISDAIIEGLSSIEVEVAMESNCTGPINVAFSPASQNVTSGDHANFTETISVDDKPEPGTYTCEDWATIDGEPMRDEFDEIIVETKTIHIRALEQECSEGDEICKTVYYLDEDGDGIIEVGERVDFLQYIDINNTGSDVWENVIVRDNFGAEIRVGNQAASVGTVEIEAVKGKSGKLRVTWDSEFDIGPGETETLTLWTYTGLDPDGLQHYTECSWHEYNSGAVLKAEIPSPSGRGKTKQVAFGTDSVMVSVLTEDRQGDCDGDGFMDEDEEDTYGTDPHDEADFPGCGGINTVDFCLDGDGIATTGRGSFSAVWGSPLSTWPTGGIGPEGIDWFDLDGNLAWTVGVDAIHLERTASCATGTSSGDHVFGQDCILLDIGSRKLLWSCKTNLSCDYRV